MKKIFIYTLAVGLLCATLLFAYDSTMSGVEVQAELDRCVGRNTTIGAPGSDAELVTEQAVREALNLKEDTLVNKSGLYSTLSDVTQFVEPGDAVTLLNGTTWRLLHTDGTGDVSEIGFGTDGMFFESNGASAAPGFRSLIDGDIPSTLARDTEVADLQTDDMVTLSGMGIGSQHLSTFTGTTITDSSTVKTALQEIETSLELKETADSTIAKTDEAETLSADWVNTANPWVDNEVSNTITIDGLRYELLTSEPITPVVGISYYADNDTWDPCDLTGTTNYIAKCTGTSPSTYVLVEDDTGVEYYSSIERAVLKASVLDDTTDPHVLTTPELKNKILTNVESTGADEWDFPAKAGGWDFDFIIEAVQNVELDSNGSEQWYLNGTQLAAGTNISNNAPTVGEILRCFSTDTNIYCESDYSDWKQGSFDCSSYDICQNFEGTGYDNSETWDETNIGGATIDEDYAVSPITGSQSLQIVDAGADGYVFTNFAAHADGATTYVYFRMRVDVSVGQYAHSVFLYDDAGHCGDICLKPTGVLWLIHGSVDSSGTTDVSGGGVFHVWVDWKTETGAGNNGVMNLYVCADSSCGGVKPGTAEISITTGNANRPGVNTLRINAEGGATIIYDRIVASDSTIGDML